ncbi:hypothetical protein M0R72_00495 [Candidatus Pacearchaeota archaeon]|jgi:hypothetical protein|nr:hypothetical protein [Candidatus Pacearchaeota archaeon]
MITPEGMKEVKGPDDVPDGHHFAVIIFDRGDKRSRTCPGNGYPAYIQS